MTTASESYPLQQNSLVTRSRRRHHEYGARGPSTHVSAFMLPLEKEFGWTRSQTILGHDHRNCDDRSPEDAPRSRIYQTIGAARASRRGRSEGFLFSAGFFLASFTNIAG